MEWVKEIRSVTLKPGNGSIILHGANRKLKKSSTLITLPGYGFYDPIAYQLNGYLCLPSLSKPQVPHLKTSILLRMAKFIDRGMETEWSYNVYNVLNTELGSEPTLKKLCGWWDDQWVGRNACHISMMTWIWQLGLAACVCHPSMWVAETGQSLDLAQCQSSSSSVRNPISSEQGGWVMGLDSQHPLWPPTHTRMHRHIYICIHTHTYTHSK